MTQTIGTHLTCDFYDCPTSITGEVDEVRGLIHAVAECLQVRILQEAYQRFAPVGVTGFAIVSESHIAVHTWPEYQYLALDVFSCRGALPGGFFPLVEAMLQTQNYRYQLARRTVYLPKEAPLHG